MKNYDVIIVGGGVAGLATANALAHKGVRSVVIEKSKAPGEVDRGDVIHQSMIDSFEKWGILDLFETHQPIRFQEFQILNNAGKRFFHIDIAKEFNNNTHFTVLKHPDIERFLEDAAIKSNKVIVNRGEVCRDLILQNGKVTGVITNKTTYNAALVVVANGARSAIRDRYFGKPNYYEYPTSFYNGCFELIPKFDNSGYYILGKKGVLILVPLPNGQMRIGVQFKKGEKVSSKNIKDVILERLASISKNDLNFIDGHIYRIFKSMSEKWHISGAILLGDAAHTVHPVGGQGMNLAFKDADTFAELLEEKRFDEAGKLYEKRRMKEVEMVLKRTHIMGVLGAINNPLYVSFREKVISLASNISFFKKKIFERIIHIR